LAVLSIVFLLSATNYLVLIGVFEARNY